MPQADSFRTRPQANSVRTRPHVDSLEGNDAISRMAGATMGWKMAYGFMAKRFSEWLADAQEEIHQELLFHLDMLYQKLECSKSPKVASREELFENVCQLDQKKTHFNTEIVDTVTGQTKEECQPRQLYKVLSLDTKESPESQLHEECVDIEPAVKTWRLKRSISSVIPVECQSESINGSKKQKM
ncbi:hypothetical protein Bpfe_022084 [Biomphalaria pfeifferi]|uniref:Uncharacterized protein n=1 Tax=Biomphalaria pfeifferi TaxID=112525 RepID=A0AAD8F396_BIOPF|nr:hypothetical protein Bpfe_022084 [Biomphalaria pfeifferi]